MGAIKYASTSIEELQKVLVKLDNTLNEENEDVAGMACIAYSILLQAPDIKLEKLIEGVKGASEWLALYCSDYDTPVDKSRMN